MTENKSITFTTQCTLGPGLDHLKTEDGAKQFDAAVEQRNKADYECFLVLRDLAEEFLLTEAAIRKTLLRDDEYSRDRPEETKEHSTYLAERVKDVLDARKKADAGFSYALLGRSS